MQESNLVVNRQLPVSLIIPLGEGSDRLRVLLCALARGKAWPREIIIVCAGQQSKALLDDLQILISDMPSAFASCIRLLSHGKPLFPGAARNLGISHSNCDWLAFLDVNTIPSESWLLSVFCSADEKLRPVVLGATLYLPSSWKQLLFIQATYGLKPLRTLPGTLVHRKLMNQVGGFLPGVRAGEDTDWLVRLNEFGLIAPAPNVTFLTYRAVPNTIRSLTAKWFRNYKSCAPIVFHLETQKTIYFAVANCTVLYVAFRWNALAAGWQQSSLFYIDDITKITLFAISIFYLLLRGLFMPVGRGSSLAELLPLKWLVIGLICCLLDVVKLLAFALSPRSNRNIL